MIRKFLVAAAALAVLLLAAAPAVADVDAAARQLSSGPGLYVDPQAVGAPLSQADLDRVRTAIRGADTPIFIAALPDGTAAAARLHLNTLIDRVHKKGTYAVISPAGLFARDDLKSVNAGALANETLAAHRNDPAAATLDFVDAVSAAASGGSGGGIGAGWILIGVLVVLAVGAALVALMGSRRRRKREEASFAQVREAAEEDVTALGEDIARLDVPDSADDATRGDYSGALDAYDRAKSALAAASEVGELRGVTEALEEGRWRMECVRARLAGKPVPDRLPPCFFDPRHGPSGTSVAWSPDAGAPRQVPVCAMDADRLARGLEPEARQVLVGGSRVPYWSAGPAYAPYAGGFFGGWGGGNFLSGLLLGEVLAGPGIGGWGGYGYGPGWGGGYEGAGYEGAGYGADGGAGGGDGGGGGGDFASGFDFGGGGWDGGDSGGSGDFGGGDGGGGGFGGGGWDGGGGDFGGGDFGGGGGNDSGGGGSW